MLVSKNAKICVTPNPNPQREQVELGGVGSPCKILALAIYRFHVVCASFSALATRKLANANADSGGIQ